MQNKRSTETVSRLQPVAYSLRRRNPRSQQRLRTRTRFAKAGKRDQNPRSQRFLPLRFFSVIRPRLRHPH